MLPIKKIYIDTRFKAPDSRSDTDFYIDLPTTLLMPEDTGFYIDDVCIPHTWYTVEEGRNDQFHFSFMTGDATATVPPGIYEVAGLGTAIAKAISDRVQKADAVVSTYNKLYESITISLTNTAERFNIWTDAELTTGSKTEVLSRSINTLIKNYVSKPNDNTPWTSGYIDMIPMRNVYLNCSGLGNFNTMTLNGNRNVVKKIPVNANAGDMIFDQTVTGMDYLDCSSQTLSRIYFRLTDAFGNTVDLHGNHFTFSIVFSRVQDGS